MKFVHIADLHLDTPLVSLKNNRELIKARRNEQKQVFKDVIKFIKTEKIDVLFIAGDLFEHKFVEKSTVEFIINSLEIIPDTKVFITPGNHDPLLKNSPYMNYEWPSNVKIFGEKIEKFSLNDEVDIYGMGFENFEVAENDFETFKVDNVEKTNILVTHGTLNGVSNKYNDINSKYLSQFDYVALGHIHLPTFNEKIIYSGTLVSCGFDECGEHGMVVGNIENGIAKYEFKNMEYRHFVDLEIDVSDIKTSIDIFDKVDLKDDIYRITFKGARNVDVKDLIELLKSRSGSITDFKDETHLPYNFDEIAKQQTLKGIFTRKMLEELEKNPSQKDEIMKAIEITYNAF